MSTCLRQFSQGALTTSAILAAAPLATAQSNWVDFADATTTRLVTTSVVASSDPEEKDFSVGDFDRDGDTDVIVVRKVPLDNPGPRTNLLLMNESGVLIERSAQYVPEFSIPDDTRDLCVFDVDNDGWLDFVTATTSFEQPRLFMNLGDNTAGQWQGFLANPNWMTAPFSPQPLFTSVVSGDVNGDGFDDLFFTNFRYVPLGNTVGDRLVMNNGDGSFTDETSTRLLSSLFLPFYGTQGHIEDLNGDGWLDILSTSGAPSPPDITYNDQTGRFLRGTSLPTTKAYQSGVADLDNDNDLDVYICDDTQDYMFFNEGTAAPSGDAIWSARVDVSNSPLTARFNHHNHLVDIDRDGLVDIGIANVDLVVLNCTQKFALLQNRLSVSTSRGFSDPNAGTPQPWNSPGTFDFAWLDINGDGCLDMIQGLCAGYKVFLQTNCPGPGIDLCNGDGGNQMGCTNCPCNNNATPGTTGGCLNSSGNSGELVDSGVPSVSADTLRFEATGLPAGAFSILTSGDSLAPTNGANPCFGLNSGAQAVQFDGLRCAVVNTRRHGGRPADANGDVGLTNNGWGPPSGPPIGLVALGGYVAGQTRNYQLIYREDPLLGCLRALNTSQAVSMTFLP